VILLRSRVGLSSKFDAFDELVTPGTKAAWDLEDLTNMFLLIPMVEILLQIRGNKESDYEGKLAWERGCTGVGLDGQELVDSAVEGVKAWDECLFLLRCAGGESLIGRTVCYVWLVHVVNSDP